MSALSSSSLACPLILSFVVDISKSVVDVDNQLIKEGTVLGEDAAVECLKVVS